MGIATKTQANEMSALRMGVRTLAIAFCIDSSLNATKVNRACFDLRINVLFRRLAFSLVA